MTGLTELSVGKTGLTQAGFAKLREALPDCKIKF